MRPNIVFITADDMNWDAVGAYGCPVEGTTPNIDALAAGGIRFEHAHVTIAVCQPSRNVLMSGRYPHRGRGEGFFNLREEGIPILPEVLRIAGYDVGILGKVGHSTPYREFTWDMAYDMKDLGMGRNPGAYRKHADAFVAKAVEAERPFFLMYNSHDPHRPFYGNDHEEWYASHEPPAVAPSRTFTAGDVGAPGHLADLPEVRLEISEYYSSVRRCDDTVGELLALLRERGLEQNTIVIFLSDNGMAFPFCKTNCYLHSTRTPWIMRWPEGITPGRVETDHFISGIDLMPTLLEAAGAPLPVGMDGTSFLPLLRGRAHAGRDMCFTQFHQTAARRNYPMRCVQTKRFGYIWNPWSNQERVFKNESQSGRTFSAMKAAGESDKAVLRRVNLFLYRVPEELYDFANDPNALTNLVDDPDSAGELHRLRTELEAWMERTGDPALNTFRRRDSRKRCEQLMREVAADMGGQ
jgi:N-sulfoglucosamine sulfohydrolase